MAQPSPPPVPESEQLLRVSRGREPVHQILRLVFVVQRPREHSALPPLRGAVRESGPVSGHRRESEIPGEGADLFRDARQTRPQHHETREHDRHHVEMHTDLPRLPDQTRDRGG